MNRDKRINKIIPMNEAAHLGLQFMALNFNIRPRFRRYLKSTDGWIDFAVGFKTRGGTVHQTIRFKGGRGRVHNRICKQIDSVLVFEDDETLIEMLNRSSEEVMTMVLRNRIRIEGNHLAVLLFYYLMSLLMADFKGNGAARNGRRTKSSDHGEAPDDFVLEDRPTVRRRALLKIEKTGPGVKFLDDPYLSEYCLDDFPRLSKFLAEHFHTMPEVCPERSRLLTDWYMKNGFEKNADGRPWIPEIRQAHAFKHLMENKRPIIRENDLLAGTTTTAAIGAVMYPDSQGMLIWPELDSMSSREMNPCRITKKTAKILHHHVFPFWMRRNIKLWVTERYNNPLCEQIGDHLVAYILSKSVALSHTIADYPKLLELGTRGIREEIAAQLQGEDVDQQKRYTLEAMAICLDGVDAYARNLAKLAAKQAATATEPKRKKELERLAEICNRVPMAPPETLDEAFNAIWIMWVALHMENTNVGLSLGRMDQWLQPFFTADFEKCETDEQRNECIKHAIRLTCCFFLRCTDHIPMSPDVGKHVVGGAPANQAVTLGGVTPDGKDAVNDMTYVFLKATEMLAIRDPNVNARYNPEINSDTYLTRLCEVNLITTASPSMHNDNAVMTSLEEFKYPLEDVRDWSSTGCVEPTLSGKHIGHTGCMMMNMVAALEMALNNGTHPLMRWDVGPKTGRVDNGDFPAFEDFFAAFKTQFEFLISNAVQYNNYLGESHSVMRPTPLLSSMISDCIPNGKDLTKGGARYNSSGIACIGLADVTDSLLAVKKLVYDDQLITFAELKDAVDSNFKNHAMLHAMIMNKVARFGSGDAEALDMANRITKLTHDIFASHKNFRGGIYTTGFWSMSNHVAFGTLTGALPSGRLAGSPFTPGLTPQSNASKNLLDNIHDVAQLDPRNMSNNIAFNIKVVPAAGESHEKSVNDMFSYVKTYFQLGGMQIQLNVVNTETLRDAMAHPENYQNLLVRISGYNAYFTTLTKELQLELIHRAEFGI